MVLEPFSWFPSERSIKHDLSLLRDLDRIELDDTGYFLKVSLKVFSKGYY